VIVDALLPLPPCASLKAKRQGVVLPKLTKKTVEAVAIDLLSPTYRWDELLPAFGIKVLPSGLRRYVLNIEQVLAVVLPHSGG